MKTREQNRKAANKQVKQNSHSAITSSQPATFTTLAMGMSAVLLGGNAMAQPGNDDQPIVLDTMQIEERTIDTNPYAQSGAPYKARISGDKRRVKELADTPATISVLTQTLIKESGKTDLRDVLATQPGITLGTGENGNAFGDRYIVRGHEARSDVFVDGLRDPGMTTRESFATEQVEVTKGPSSTFAGRGSTGGAVNSITKQANTEYNFNKVEGSLGTDSNQRITLDSNNRITDDLAVRVNLLHASKDIPDRAPADKERNGIALSGTYQATDELSVIADYYYLEAKDKPDLGTYILSQGKPVKDIPVYAQNNDFLDSDVETFTFRVNYDINESLSLSNSTRYGTTENGYVVTGARGSSADFSTAGLSTHQGWQEVDYFVNQLNLYLDTELAGMSHKWVFSAEYSDLGVTNGTYNTNNTGATNCIVTNRRGSRPGYCIADSTGATAPNLNSILGREISRGEQDSDFNVETLSLAIMDTVDITEQWSVFLGLRLDSFDYDNTVGNPGSTTNYSYSDTLWNGHAGVVYNISDEANVYFSYSTSSNINGGESDLGGNCGYGGLCGDPTQVTESEPENTENLELGTKWNLLDDQLLFTAAIFQITKDDVMESVGDDYETLGTLNTGKNRVKGFELSLVGNITDNLSTQFGLTMMDSEVLESYNTDSEGEILGNFADDSVFLQLRYQATDKFSIGGSATYSSDLYSGQPDSAAGENYRVPSYTVFDVFANYEFTEQLKARLNVGNITDKDYYLASYRSGAFTYMGDARNAQLSVEYEF
jgi:catecholate siderophore receptor